MARFGRSVVGVYVVGVGEGLLEVVDLLEVLEAIGGAFLEQVVLYHGKDDVAEVPGGGDVPVLEHQQAEHAPFFDCQVSQAVTELGSGDVPFCFGQG